MKVTLTDAQKTALCIYAHDNKITRAKYVDWIEQQWGVRIDEISNSNVKRHRAVTVSEVELALKEFVLNYQYRTILSDTILIQKVKLLAAGLGVPEGTLQFSSSWLQKFKECNGIRQIKLQGKAVSADNDAITSTLPLLRSKCANYSLYRIYNMDKTGLFYCLEPDRILATHRIARCKVDKEHILVALCANADGSYKLNPLIIGKYQKPRCFKNINIKNMPFIYRNNTKAWMITTFFQDWFKEFDHQVSLKHDGQRALLLLDKCSSHKTDYLNLQYVDVYFLSAKTTSKIQLIDAGIIMKDLKMDVLQAIRYAIQDWEEVSAETIRNCWRHTKILPISSNVDLQNLSKNICQVEEFLSIPEENFVYEVPDDDCIISEIVKIFKKNEEDLDETEEMDNSSEIPIVSADLVLESLETVYIYLLQQDNT
ncbi:7750_t:CDS:2, partial [Dentiscutata erythropus]